MPIDADPIAPGDVAVLLAVVDLILLLVIAMHEIAGQTFLRNVTIDREWRVGEMAVERWRDGSVMARDVERRHGEIRIVLPEAGIKRTCGRNLQRVRGIGVREAVDLLTVIGSHNLLGVGCGSPGR